MGIRMHSLALTAASLSEVEADQLHHVRFQKVDVPPGRPLRSRQGARVEVEEGAGASVDGLLRDATLLGTDLHWRLPRCHVQHCNG